MKLYAVVIGKKGKHTRYVAYSPYFSCDKKALAVYEKMSHAKLAKQRTLDECGHTDVCVIRFIVG